MRKKRKSAKPVSAEQIARMADKGKSVATFFKCGGAWFRLTQRVSFDSTTATLELIRCGPTAGAALGRKEPSLNVASIARVFGSDCGVRL